MSEDVPGLVAALADDEPPERPRRPAADAARQARAAAGLALGAAGLATSAVASALREIAPPPDEAPPTWRLSALPGTGVDLALKAGRAVPAPGFVRRRFEHLAAAQRERERAAAALLEAAVPQIVQAVLDRVDLNEVIARVDVEAVLRRVDLDAMIARVDLDAAIHRIDLSAVTVEVMEDIDFGEIIRESTMSIGGQTVDSLRVQSVRGDELLAAFVDRLVRRQRRETGLEPGDWQP